MTKKNSSATALKIETQAGLFGALGDPTRLTLVKQLMDAQSHSIASLTEGTKISRQAVTKHLDVLEEAGLVLKFKTGRESLYELNPAPFEDIKEYLTIISQEWNDSLHKLKRFLED